MTATHKPKPSLAQRAKRDPALLKRALADPGLRSKLPSSMLSIAQQRARKTNTTNAALGDVTTPLSGGTLIDVANKLVNGQYDPQLAELDRQGQQATALGDQSSTRAQGIYKQLQDFQAAQAAQQHAAGAAGAAATAANTQTALGQADEAAKQIQAQQAADEAVRGGGLDGGAAADAATRAAQEGASIASEGQTDAANQQTNAAAIDAVLAGIGNATQQRGGEEQGAIRTATKAALDDLAAKRLGLTTEKGGALADKILALRQQGADEYYTGAGLNLNSAKALQDSADRAAALKAADDRARRSDSTTRRGQDISSADRKAALAARRAADAKKKGKGAHLGTSAQNSAKDAIDAAVAQLAPYKGQGLTAAQLEQIFATGIPAHADKTGKKVAAVKAIASKDYRQAAIDMATQGYLSQATIDALHARKIQVLKLGYPTKPTPHTVLSNAAASVIGGVNHIAGN